MPEDQPRHILMHPALLRDFDAWLQSRGLECREAPGNVWIITPTDEALRDRVPPRGSLGSTPPISE